MLAETLITRERALEAIGAQRLAQLREVQQDGWREWEVIRATKEGATLSASARARIVYDATVRRALETFPASAVTWHHGLLVVDLGEVLARFKKLTDEFCREGSRLDRRLFSRSRATSGRPPRWLSGLRSPC